MRRVISLLMDPGPADRWPPFVLRLVLALVFIPAGIGKFANHDAYITRFDRWGFPQPSAFAYSVGVVEIGAGLLMLLGIAPRLVAAGLAANMVGALATAGRVDGGQNIWLPLVLIVICLAIVSQGGGRYALHERVFGRRSGAAT